MEKNRTYFDGFDISININKDKEQNCISYIKKKLFKRFNLTT